MSESAKKRLMYLTGEDFYLLCYSIFVVLDSLGCSSESKFRDYRKLPFLINIINDERLVYIISNATPEYINPYDREHLFNSYSDGLMKRSEILKLLFTLEKKEYLILEKGKKQSEIDVSINKSAMPDGFLGSDIFKSEYEKFAELKSNIARLKTLKLETMLEKIYSENGVKTWAI